MSNSGFKARLKKYSKDKVVWTLVFSFVLHIVLLSWHIKLDQFVSKVDESKKKKIRVVLVDKKPKKKNRQIVNNDDTGKNEVPLDSRFLSQKNQKYDRQTRAKVVGVFKKAGAGVKNGARNAQSTAKAVKKQQKQQQKLAKKVFVKGRRKIKLSDLSVRKNPNMLEKVEQRIRMAALGKKNGDLNQRGPARNNDFIEDVPLGDMARLNTSEYKYYGFYHRIRQKLEQHWESSLREKAEHLFRSGRRMPASDNKITALKVKLDNKGNIVNVLVKDSSGVRELDDAAIESFNKAGPFPNPPKGMLKNGYVDIEWGFVVNT